MIRFILITIYTLIINSISLYSQDLFTSFDYRTRIVNRDSKIIPDNNVVTVLQDRLGFNWIITSTSLVRYSGGLESKIYTHFPGDKNSFPACQIKSAIYYEKEDVFYLGTDIGVVKFTPELERFVNMHENLLPPFGLNQIKPGMKEVFDSLLIVPLMDAIYLINIKNDKLELIINEELINTETWPESLKFQTIDKKGNLWFSSANNGFYKINIQNESANVRLYSQCFTIKTGLPLNASCVFNDSHGNLYFASNGLFKLCALNSSEEDLKYIDIFNGEESTSEIEFNINDIIEDKNGNIWISTYYKGIKRLNSLTNVVEDINFSPKNYNQEISNTGYFQIDKEENLWILFDNNVLVRYDDQSNSFFEFKYHPVENGSFVKNYKTENFKNNFVWDTYGNYWLIGDRNGLTLFERLNKNFSTLNNRCISENGHLSEGMVWGIFKDSQNNLFVGINSWGLNIVNLETREVKRLSYSGKGEPNAFKIITGFLESSSGDYWFGSIPIQRYSFDDKNNLVLEDEYIPCKKDSVCISSWVAFYIYEDRRGRIFLGTKNNGLEQFIEKDSVLKESFFKHYKKDSKLMDNTSIAGNEVWHIMEDVTGNLWISTSTGLSIFDESRKKFRNFYHDEEDQFSISSNIIRMCHQDKDGTVWIATEGGGVNKYISKDQKFIHYNTSNGFPTNNIFSVYSDNSDYLWCSSDKGLIRFDSKNEEYIVFTKEDGLLDEQFFAGAHFKSRDGLLFYGGANGITYFYPDSIDISETEPTIRFTQLKIENQEIRVNQNYKGKIILKKELSYLKNIILDYSVNNFSIEFTALNYGKQEKLKYKYLIEGVKTDWIETSSIENFVLFLDVPPGEYVLKVKSTNSLGVWVENTEELSIVILPPFWRTLWFYSIEGLAIISFLIILFRLRNKKLLLERRELYRRIGIATSELEKRNEELIIINKLLEESKEEIQLQNEELIMHRRNLEKEIEIRTHKLRKALVKAKESDRLKSSFLSNMSHEIRTPLNAIVGFSSLLRNNSSLLKDKNEYISLIISNSESLLKIVEEILDFSLIESEQLPLLKEVFALNELIENVYYTCLESNKNPNIKFLLNNEVSIQNYFLNTDKHRLEQVIKQLIHNAIKFTNLGTIELGVSSQKGDLIIYIKDTGIGISEGEKKKIFNQFYKIETVDNTFRGLGLGLSLSHRLTKLLGGQIKVESKTGIDSGSIFSLHFPIAMISLNQPFITNNKALEFKIDLSGRNVFIIEDNIESYKFLKATLEDMGVNIYWASKGKDAINIFYEQKENINLIILDIWLPDISGFELITMFKSIQNIPIIVQTAYSMPQHILKILESGCDDYLTKPFKYSSLLKMLKKYLA